MNPCRLCFSAVFLLFALFGAGCSKTPQSIYYTLNAMEGNGVVLPSSDAGGGVSIGIVSVKFPEELDRPNIVTRSGENRLVMDEFHRWGGTLEKNFTRVMVEDLSLLLKSDRVRSRPWEHSFQPDVRITLEIRQFTGRLGEYALINATWTMLFKGEGSSPTVRSTVINESVADDSYDAYVAAQSRAISALANEIASSVSGKLPSE